MDIAECTLIATVVKETENGEVRSSFTIESRATLAEDITTLANMHLFAKRARHLGDQTMMPQTHTRLEIRLALPAEATDETVPDRRAG